jgi:hypothetical protein
MKSTSRHSKKYTAEAANPVTAMNFTFAYALLGLGFIIIIIVLLFLI